jgi:phosphate-selective porin OprO/OprP
MRSRCTLAHCAAQAIFALLIAAAWCSGLQAQAAATPAAETDTSNQTPCAPDESSWPCAMSRFNARMREDLNEEPQGREGRLLGIHYDGYLMLDAAGADSALTDGDQIQIRRANLGFERPLGDTWRMRGSAELKTGRFELQDFYLRRDWRNGRVTLGNQTEPFGLEDITSAQYTTLLERSLSAALVPARNIGAAYDRRDGDWYWSIGTFGFGTANDGLRTKGFSGDGRLVWSRADADDRMLHLGAAVSVRRFEADHDLRFRTTPEVAMSNVYLVDTGTIPNVANVNRAGFEYAQFAGAWEYQAEAVETRVTRSDGSPNLTFHGAYAEVSWFPWQGQRRYNADQARFVAVDAAGTNIVQFSARLSNIDLSSGEIAGGRQTDVTLGAKWFPTRRLHFGANWVYVLKLDGGPRNGIGEHDNAFVVRAQYDAF